MRKLERSRRRAGTGGEKRGVTKKGQKAKIYGKRKEKTHQIAKNVKIRKEESRRRRRRRSKERRRLGGRKRR